MQVRFPTGVDGAIIPDLAADYRRSDAAEKKQMVKGLLYQFRMEGAAPFPGGAEALHAILAGDLPFQVDGDAILFDLPETTKKKPSAKAAEQAKTTTACLPLDSLRVDGGTQPRAALDEEHVERCREAIEAGHPVPPPVAYYDGKDHWLADGFHRREGHARAKKTTILVEVRQGTRRDAVLYSVGANADHGLPRTPADKWRAVETLLRDEEWGKWGDREIARQCRVSPTYVGRVRSALSVHRGQMGEPAAERMVSRGGTTYTMKTPARKSEPATLPSPPSSPKVATPARPTPPKPVPMHPHSDRLARWIEFVAGEAMIIKVELGGIEALLSEPGKWDWRKVREYILPMLGALEGTLREFGEEIRKRAGGSAPGGRESGVSVCDLVEGGERGQPDVAGLTPEATEQAVYHLDCIQKELKKSLAAMAPPVIAEHAARIRQLVRPGPDRGSDPGLHEVIKAYLDASRADRKEMLRRLRQTG